MKTKILLAACIGLFQITTFAAEDDDKTTSKTKISSNDRREISVAPGANYTESNGWAYGASVSYAHPVSKRSQLEVGGIFFKYSDSEKAGTDESMSGVFAGPTFNFGSDFSSNFFAGIGAGYSNYLPFKADPDRDTHAVFGYGQLGKRFSLNSEDTFSYKPRVFAYSGSSDVSSVHFDLLNFSYLF